MIDMLPPQKVRDLDALRAVVKKKFNKAIRSNFPAFAKYFKPIVEIALQQEHPLDYWLIRQIYADGDLTRLNEDLQSIENKFGEDFLTKLFDEIKGQARQPDNLLFKLRSMYAEVDCARFLSCATGSAHISKIPESGDILFRLNDQEWVFAVKNPLEEYISLECIADVLAGMMWLEDNNILRFYNRRIELEGQEINDSFRKKVISFIHEDFISVLKGVERRIREPSFKNLRYDKFSLSKDSLKITIDIRQDQRQTIIIQAKIKDPPRIISLRMGQASYQSDFYNIVSYLPAWWIGEQPNWEKVSNKLKEHIQKACKQLEKVERKGIFIRFNPQPEHEEALIQDIENPQSYLLNTINHELPIVLYLPFRFNPPRYMLNKSAEKAEFLRRAGDRIAAEALQRLKGIGKSGLKDVGRQKHKYLSDATL